MIDQGEIGEAPESSSGDRFAVARALSDHRPKGITMLYLIVKALVSAALIVAASELARRHPGTGALVASLPLVSVLGMLWLWHDRPDVTNMAAHAEATFWYVIPSLPMFLAIPAMLRQGVAFLPALVAGCLLTMALYSLMVWLGPRFGLPI